MIRQVSFRDWCLGVLSFIGMMPGAVMKMGRLSRRMETRGFVGMVAMEGRFSC